LKPTGKKNWQLMWFYQYRLCKNERIYIFPINVFEKFI
jgi:hypothetical protein